MNYADIDPAKRAFIFELDNVLFPKKDYDLQVYYLFAAFLEFQEAFPPASELVSFLKKAYENHGTGRIFEKAQEVFGFDAKYKENFERLHREARLPLKLLLFQNVLTLLQEMVIDRKQLFIVTGGNTEQQLNKIKQIEWHGLEKYLKVYFADEIRPKPDIDVITHIMKENGLKSGEILLFRNESDDKEFASAAKIDYIAIQHFI
ncbi:MAG TPA: HAD hydrolase-like protein [Pedobacter sp.]|jgi:phosphoglycolate phosphatase-like HAD superfamily hydrolase